MERENFVHLELRGNVDEIKAFIEGFRLAIGEDRVFSAARENIKVESFLSGLTHRSAHFLVPASFEEPLKEALAKEDRIEISIEARHPIDHAELKFAFRCYSRDVGVEVRKVIEQDLPEGVVLEGMQVDEEIDDGAKGSELYSPVHDYDLQGEGLYHGPVEGIIAVGRRLADQDFIHPERIQLVYGH